MAGRHRKCGCDSRDDGEFVQDVATFNPLCCESCGVTPPPCCYVAHFGCVISCDGEPFTSVLAAGATNDPEATAGDVFLRVICEFENKCVYASMRADSHADPGFSDGCTWTHREIGYNPSDSVAWQMDIADLSAVTLTYTFGVWDGTVVYTCNDDFICNAANTFTLTTNTTGCVQFPNYLCVTPKYARDVWCAERAFESNYPTCPTDVTGEVEQVGDGGYADRLDRCSCCDPGCDTLPGQPLFLSCGECSESTTVIPTVGGGNGLDGVDSPSGQTYGACATQCGVEQCANWYCSSGQWKVDLYNDGNFCFTADITHECCPLSLGTGAGPTCSGCENCVGADCGVPTDCCPDDDVPTTLTASFGPNTETPECDEGTAEGTSLSLVYDSANDWWDGSATTDTGNLGFRIWCDAGTWMGEPRCNGSAANSPSPLTLVSCNPFEATATATFGASCGGCHDGATEITQTYLITITA